MRLIPIFLISVLSTSIYPLYYVYAHSSNNDESNNADVQASNNDESNNADVQASNNDDGHNTVKEIKDHHECPDGKKWNGDGCEPQCPDGKKLEHGTSAPTYAINSNKLEHIGIHFNDKSIPATLILPNYVGNSFSYSIPFTGSALEFLYDKPFVAVYTVNAQVIIQKSTDSSQKVLSQEMPGAYFKASAGTLLIEVIPYLTVDTLQELPFSDLSSSDLSMIIDKVPVDSAQVILKKLPADKQQEILKDLSAEKRQEIGMLTTK